MTTTAELRRPTPFVRIGRPGAALLVIAPLVMALGRLLLVPFDDQDLDNTLTDMAAHQGRSDVGWILAVAACGLLGTTGAILGGRLREQYERTANFTVVSITVGWAATAGIAGGMLVLSAMAKATDRAS